MNKRRFRNIISRMWNRSIEYNFPSKMRFTKFASDTVDYQIPVSNYKIVVYVDSLDCTSCKLQLAK